MTECLTTLCNSCISIVGEDLYVSIKRHICYLIRCKRYVEELTNEVYKLSPLREHLQLSVDKARSNGDDINLVLQHWMTRVIEFEDRVKDMTNGDKKIVKCLKGWHPNCSSRYRLGKEAKMKINDVKNLLDEGGKFSPVASVALCPPPACFEDGPRGDFEAYESTRSAMEQIMEALKDDNISIVGVFGMGGIGKTTLVKEVGYQVRTEKLFKVVIMVTVSQKYSVIEIQEEIAENLGMELKDKSSTQRKAKLFKRLKEVTNILLILDDLWEKLELGEVGIPIGEDHKGCKIVLTSRSISVCNKMNCQKAIEVDILSEPDSWRLFWRNVGDLESSELQSIAQKVAKECGGLPLALVTAGQSMRNETNLRVWKDSLLQLGESDPRTIEGMLDKVFLSIAHSYNRLESKEIKLCFLFCCLFPEDYEIDVNDLTFYWIAEGFIKSFRTLEQARDRVHVFVKYLKDRGLLLGGTKKNCVKLHDVVRDVAIHIASEDEHRFLAKARVQMENVKAEEWQGCKRVSQMHCGITSVDNEMLKNQNQRLLTTLLLQNNPLKKLPDNLFEGMKSLVALDLSRTRISTLPPSFPCLLNLRMLCLDYCYRLKDVSQLRGIKKLLTLHLRSTRIQALTEEIGELTNLIFLDLRDNRFLETIAPNVISRLVDLQELYMDNSFSGWKIEGRQEVVRRDLYGSNASIAEVGSLTKLTSLGINRENEGCLISEEELPPSPSIGQTAIFQNLRQLRIGPSFSVKRAFPLTVARGLLHLDTLQIFNNIEMEEVISMEDGEVVDKCLFPQLRTLGLSMLVNLKRFYRSSVVLDWPSLECIDVDSCFQLKRLPIGLQSAPNLKNIKGQKEWFKGVEWEDDSVKKRMQTLFQEQDWLKSYMRREDWIHGMREDWIHGMRQRKELEPAMFLAQMETRPSGP